jgi:seryl-tRNA(Sec) selenium transferase
MVIKYIRANRLNNHINEGTQLLLVLKQLFRFVKNFQKSDLCEICRSSRYK